MLAESRFASTRSFQRSETFAIRGLLRWFSLYESTPRSRGRFPRGFTANRFISFRIPFRAGFHPWAFIHGHLPAGIHPRDFPMDVPPQAFTHEISPWALTHRFLPTAFVCEWFSGFPCPQTKTAVGVRIPTTVSRVVSSRSSHFITGVRTTKWSEGESNSRPQHCERCALPTELSPRF